MKQNEVELKCGVRAAHLTDVSEVFDVDALSVHDLLDHVSPHLLSVLRRLAAWFFRKSLLLFRRVLHTVTGRVLLIHTHLRHKRTPCKLSINIKIPVIY